MANQRKELISVLAMLLMAIILLFFFQKPLSLNDGLGWDGQHYYSLADQFAHHQVIVGVAPYVYRIGTPFLVGALFKNHLMFGFFLINLLASIAAVLLLMIWLRLYIDNWIIRCFLIGLYMAHWLGPLRTTFFYPTQNEALPQVFTLLGFILVHLYQQNKSVRYVWLLGLIGSLGVLVRESLILVPLVYMLATLTDWYQIRGQEKKIPWLSGIPFLASILSIILLRQFIKPVDFYSFLGDILFWLYSKPLPAYIHAYFVAVGPILVVIALEWRVMLAFIRRHIFISYFLIITCILSWIIGSDTDRFLFWAIPAWYILIGLALEKLWPLINRSWMLLGMIIIFQAMAEAALRPIPDFAPEKIRYRIPLLSVVCNDGCSLDLPSYHGWSGSGLQTAGCSILPCELRGNEFPFKFVLLLENIFAACLIAYGIMGSKRRWKNRLQNLSPG